MTRVLVCENDPAMRAALADLILSYPTLELAGVARDPDEAGDIARNGRIDAALLDVRMPKGGGPNAARIVRAYHPKARIVAFSAHAEREVVLEMLLAGASEYLIKGLDENSIADALQRTGYGHLGMPLMELEEMVFALVERLRSAAEAAPHPPPPDPAYAESVRGVR
ncbi:MAG: response regulator transcription factor [Candidatus Dormibacteraeota bacterium]|nr:response regulator transcription factor [Candidatus Dormibacteraeota bacterium]